MAEGDRRRFGDRIAGELVLLVGILPSLVLSTTARRHLLPLDTPDMLLLISCSGAGETVNQRCSVPLPEWI